MSEKKDWKFIKRITKSSNLDKIFTNVGDNERSVLDCFRDPEILVDKLDDFPSDEELFSVSQEKELI